MAFYSPLDDGSFEVVQDDGSTLRTAVDPSRFGLEMKPANVAQFDSMTQAAGPGGGLPEGVLMSEDEALAHQRGASSQPTPSLESVMQRSGIAPDRGALTQSGAAEPPPPKPKAAPIPIRPPAAPAQSGPSQNDQLKALVASQIVQRSAPRKGQGFVPTAKTVTTAPTPSQADLDTVAEEELGTEATMLEQAQQSFEARNQLLDQQIAQNAAREAKLAEQYAQRQQTDARLARLQAYAEEKERDVAEMKTLSPTDEYFKDAGGPWARVLAGAMVFLDGLGVAMSAAGGVNRQNEALQAIQRGIKERAEMLKQQYEQAQEAGRTARNAYSDALQMYGTPEMAMQALNDRGEAIADQKIVVLADKQGNQDTLNKALMWQAQRREARAMRVAERNAAAAGQQTTTYQNDRGSGGGVRIDKDMIKLYNELNGGGAGGKTLPVRLPDGTTVDAPESVAKDAREKVFANHALAQAAARIRHLMEQPGAKTDPSRRAQLGTALKGLQLKIKAKEKLGTLDAGSTEFMNEYSGDPTGFIDLGGASARLQEIEQSSLQEIEDVKRFELGIDSPPATMQSDE